MKGIKTLYLKFTDQDYESVKNGKREGETWEEYILRIANKEAK